MKQEAFSELPCPVANSRLTSGLLTIASLLEEGGVCGIPTDTVYALAASCKNPQAIEKIYNIKVRNRNKVLIKALYDMFSSVSNWLSLTCSRTDQQRSPFVFASLVWSSSWQQSLPSLLCCGSS